jgi:hypothetical protein
MKKLTAISLALLLFCGLSSTNAFSWDHFRYREGHYYRHAGWWDFGGAFVSGLAVGALVSSLPPDHETYIINGIPYYYYDGYYYQNGPDGYVVVDPPAGQPLPGPVENNSMMYILGTLIAILLISGIALLLKKLFIKERTAT